MALRAVLLPVLVCAHCSLTLFVALGALAFGGLGAPLVLGLRADMLLVPLAGLTLFIAWLWWGKRSAPNATLREQP
jgi:ABC-type transport system involved in cytochrome c biogenesis permease component